ncbi:MAG: radical SAM family heme chaperone HemW [Gemmatimonadota bacterium]
MCRSGMDLRHLYLHVPFCLRRCSYCDFAVHPTRRPPIGDWLSAIATELRLSREVEGWPARLRLSSIYIGGGTPSLLGIGAMQALRETLEQHGSIDADVEWTAEANPESFTAELGADWRYAGVNRISLGVQSFHAPALRWMGRLHGADGARAAMDSARAAGFDNVSIDLIFGLPQKLERNWPEDLDLALALAPDHISLYGLTAESGAALGRWVIEGRAAMPSEENYSDEYLTAARVLPAAGFVHYEVSNFGKPGRESRHNRAYWNFSPYLGLGPGAHSYHPPRRFWNVRDWGLYQRRLAGNALPREDSEVVDRDSLERIWLGLRTREGAYLPDRTEIVQRHLKQWQGAGWAEVDAERVRLTPAGWLLLDRLAVELEGMIAA